MVTAYDQALRFLGRRDYFRGELVERVVRAGHAAAEAEAAVDRCAALDLIDDVRLARRFVELRMASRGWGPHRLELELRRRGVDTELARSSAAVSGESLPKGLELALSHAERRTPAEWWRSGASRSRMISSLLRRGYDAEDARAAVDHLAARRETEHHALDDEPRDPEDLS